MNDLDRRIAELKGFEERDYGAWFPKDSAQPGYIFDPNSPIWSGSDTKALELVDELVGPKSDRLAILTFGIALGTHHTRRIGANGPDWHAVFYEDTFQGARQIAKAEAPTRPEAICRAYIAAKVWQAQKSEPEARYRCPACKSEHLAQKTGGHLGPEETNPFGARCGGCGWTGTIGQTVIAAREWMRDRK